MFNCNDSSVRIVLGPTTYSYTKIKHINKKYGKFDTIEDF